MDTAPDLSDLDSAAECSLCGQGTERAALGWVVRSVCLLSNPHTQTSPLKSPPYILSRGLWKPAKQAQCPNFAQQSNYINLYFETQFGVIRCIIPVLYQRRMKFSAHLLPKISSKPANKLILSVAYLTRKRKEFTSSSPVDSCGKPPGTSSVNCNLFLSFLNLVFLFWTCRQRCTAVPHYSPACGNPPLGRRSAQTLVHRSSPL